jgi:hypothetical protein
MKTTFWLSLVKSQGELHCVDDHLDGQKACGINGGVGIVDPDAKAIVDEPPHKSYESTNSAHTARTLTPSSRPSTTTC